jgi:hypothetical protein
MPPRHPYPPPGPGSSGIPRTRPNYTKLGMLLTKQLDLASADCFYQI